MRVKNLKNTVLATFVLASAVAIAQTGGLAVKTEKLVLQKALFKPRNSPINFVETFLNAEGKKIKIMCAANISGNEITAHIEGSRKDNAPDAVMAVGSCQRFLNKTQNLLRKENAVELRLSEPEKDWSGASYFRKIELNKI